MRTALISLLLGVASAQQAPWTNYTQKQYWFENQLVDHFDLVDNRTYGQRYWVVNDFWKPTPDSPIVLYLCGEYTCPGVTPGRLFPLEIAYDHDALIVIVEHRFYGKSYPFPDLATENLKYLNSRQALADLAYFSTFFQESYVNAKTGAPAGYYGKWIVIGGSYPGALSAWYRTKYPHLSVGALASSAVVNAILDFPQFDEHVANATADMPHCTDALRATTASIEAQMPAIKTKFGAAQMDDGDFYFMVADAMAEGVQYGHKELLCSSVVPAYLAGQDPVPGYLTQWFAGYWEPVMGNGPDEYDWRVLADPVNGGDSRSWQWQTCTEVGWWQVAPAQGSIRSQHVNHAYYQDLCSKVFGLSTPPNVAETNNYYGGVDIAGYNILFTNGIDDPWQEASVPRTISPAEQEITYDCFQCGHCQDLHTPASTDAPTLKAARAQFKSLLTSWLA